MPATRFDGAADKIVAALGGVVTTGAHTWVVVARKANLSTWSALADAEGATANLVRTSFELNDQATAAQSWGDSGSSVTGTGATAVTSTADWYGLGVAHPSNGTPTFIRRDLTTNATAATELGSTTKSDNAALATQIIFGLWNNTDDFNGWLACVAFFNGALTTAQLTECFANKRTSDIWNCSFGRPAALWEFNGSAAYDLTGGGANETSRVGATLDALETPPWTYDGTGFLPILVGSNPDNLNANAHTCTTTTGTPGGTRLFLRTDWIANVPATITTAPTSSGLTWTKLASGYGGGGAENMGTEIWTALITTPIASGHTVSWSLSAPAYAATSMLFHQMNTAAIPLDGTPAITVRTSSFSSTVPAPSTTIAGTDDTLYSCALGDGGATGGMTYTVSAPWAEPWQEVKNAPNDWSSGMAVQRVTTPGSYSGSGTWGGSPGFGDFGFIFAVCNATAAASPQTSVAPLRNVLAEMYAAGGAQRELMLELVRPTQAGPLALTAINFALSSGWEAIGGKAAVASSPWHATRELASALSSPTDAVQGTAAAASSILDATAGLQTAASSTLDATAGLTVTRSAVLDAVTQVMATASSPWQALAGLSAPRSTPWDATGQAVTAQTVLTFDNNNAHFARFAWNDVDFQGPISVCFVTHRTDPGDEHDHWMISLQDYDTGDQVFEFEHSGGPVGGGELSSFVFNFGGGNSGFGDASISPYTIGDFGKSWEIWFTWDGVTDGTGTPAGYWHWRNLTDAPGLWHHQIGLESGNFSTNLIRMIANGDLFAGGNPYAAGGGYPGGIGFIGGWAADLYADGAGHLGTDPMHTKTSDLLAIAPSAMRWGANLISATPGAITDLAGQGVVCEEITATLGTVTIPEWTFDETGGTGVVTTVQLMLDAIGALAATRSTSLDAIIALTAPRSAPYEAQLAIANVASSPTDAAGGLASVSSAPTDALGSSSTTASSVLDATGALLAARSSPLDATAQLLLAASSVLDALQGLNAAASSPWDATSSLNAVNTIASTPFDAIAQLQLAASSAVDAAALLAIASSTPWEASRQVAAAQSAVYDAIAGLQAVASSPWDAIGSAVTPVSATVTLLLDAVAQLLVTASAPTDATALLALAASSVLDAQQGLAGTRSTVLDALGGAGATPQLQLDALATLQVNGSLSWEAQLQVALTRSTAWEGQLGLIRAVPAILDATGAITAVAVLPWDADGLKQIPTLNEPLTLGALTPDTYLAAALLGTHLAATTHPIVLVRLP